MIDPFYKIFRQTRRLLNAKQRNISDLTVTFRKVKNLPDCCVVVVIAVDLDVAVLAVVMIVVSDLSSVQI